MKMRIGSKYPLAIVVILTVAFAAACAGGGSDDSSYSGLLENTGVPGSPGAPGLSGATDALAVQGYGMTAEQFRRAREDGSLQDGPAAAAATAAPAATVVVEAGRPGSDESFSKVTVSKAGGGQVAAGGSGDGSASVEAEIAAATDGRVIVRTADLNISVEDVTRSIDDISNIAAAADGWVVSSLQSRQFQGNISIRVPAVRFDDVIVQLTDLAVKVNLVTTRSEDFTEEFTDVTARAQTLSDTLDRLRLLYDRADSVEDAITIQKEITNVQSDLESLEARLKFLSQSSAFSFISVALKSVPVELTIDAGEDVAAAVGLPVTYRVVFTPPEDMENLLVTWNFGDGSREQTTDRIVPTGNGDEVISAPIIHFFDRDEDSPFIVTVKLRGSGDGGIVEGEDTLVTTVSRLPVIEVFAGENQVVEAGSNVEFSASFTRPEGVTGVTYSWNFGDGSAPIRSESDDREIAVQVNASHIYQNFRPNPYVVTLTVTGQTEVGEVEVTGELLVFVRETIGVAAADLDAGGTVRDAARTLQSVGVFLAKAGLWLAILSPAWLVGGAVLFVLIRRRNLLRLPRRR